MGSDGSSHATARLRPSTTMARDTIQISAKLVITHPSPTVGSVSTRSRRPGRRLTDTCFREVKARSSWRHPNRWCLARARRRLALRRNVGSRLSGGDHDADADLVRRPGADGSERLEIGRGFVREMRRQGRPAATCSRLATRQPRTLRTARKDTPPPGSRRAAGSRSKARAAARFASSRSYG